MTRTVHLVVISALALMSTAIAAVAATTRDAAREQGLRTEDTLLTARVKGALVTDKVTRAHHINIETFQGIIQLSGFVSTEAEKTRAGEVVAAVPGVVEVRNAIQVRQTLARRDSGHVTDHVAVTPRATSLH
ncbi:MAG TPA: BON domain-containing protein [Steroidobacteraceae bacterium]|nr:BON domain-containing protein [Steroidobacteraceae bacterium]